MRAFVALVALASVWQAGPVQAARQKHLQPVTQWVLDYADESCRLGRNFGDGKDQITLLLIQYEPGDSFQVELAGRGLRGIRTDIAGGVDLAFGSDEESRATAMLGKIESGEPAVLFVGQRRVVAPTKEQAAALKAAYARNQPFELPPVGAAREAAVTQLRVERLLRDDIVFEAGPMDKPMAALRKCSWDLVKSWGLDVGQQMNLSRKARPKQSPSSWLSSSDYPTKMIFEGFGGIVDVRLMIDATGRPTQCAIQGSTNPDDFERVVCKAFMNRARFEPALDAAGKPVPSFWSQTVNFRVA